MLTGNMHAQRFGGMPDYIRRLRAQQARPVPASAQPSLPPGARITVRPPSDAPYVDKSGYAMPEGGVTEAEMMSAPVLPNGGWAVEPKPEMARPHAAPMGLMQQGAPQHKGQKPGMDMGLFNQSFDKPKMTWSDKLGLVSGYLMDLDGSFGTGNADRFKALYDERVDEQRSDFERKRQESIMMAAAQGDPTALAYLDPLGNRSFQYGMKRDGVQDARYEDERDYGRGRDAVADSRYVDERDYGRGRDVIGDQRWQKEFSAAEAARRASAASAGKYGVTPVFGRDANGNRVLLQTNNAGGVSQADLPEGVTLEDDYSRTLDRETAKADAKVAAYESTAGQALTAFETKTDELLLQIDDAIQKTNKGNTGFLGQFIAAGDLDGVLDSIGAKAMLSELVAIKAQGGTLGALSDSEGKALRDAAVNVARSQSEAQLDRNLQAYRLQVEKSRLVLKQAFEEQYVNGLQAPRGGANTGVNRPVGPSGQPVPEGFE